MVSLMKWLFGESLDEFRRFLVVAAWVLGVLFVGAIAVALLGFLVLVSNSTALGFGGVALVVATAAGVGWGIYRRQKRVALSSPGAIPQTLLPFPYPYQPKPPAPPRPLVLPPTPEPAPEPSRSWDALNPHHPDDRARLKQRLDETIAARDFQCAEEILGRIAQDDSEQAWCAFHRRYIDNLRRRGN